MPSTGLLPFHILSIRSGRLSKSDSVCVHSVCVAKHAKSDQAYALLFCFLPSKNFLHIVIAVKCKQKGRLTNTYLAVPIMSDPIQYFL